MESFEVVSPLFIVPVGDGIVVPVMLPAGADIERMAEAKPECAVDICGVMLVVGKVNVPLPITVVEHLVRTGQKAYLYRATEEQYVCEFVQTLDLDRDKLLKLLGTWEARYGASVA
jgi:hypothetical protein